MSAAASAIEANGIFEISDPHLKIPALKSQISDLKRELWGLPILPRQPGFGDHLRPTFRDLSPYVFQHRPIPSQILSQTPSLVMDRFGMRMI
jgi:hypothetical protein